MSTTAFFDLTEEHEIYLKHGLEAFRKYQKDNRNKIPERGSGFPFLRRLLALNTEYPAEKPVEVVILSRNHADAGLRVMDAVRHYGLDITRSFFLAGKLPYPYMASVNACIYLSTNPDEVKTAVAGGFPAGYVLPCAIRDDVADHQLRVAFDFDGVVVDDEAVYKETQDLELFHHYERERRNLPLKGGPLLELLRRISHFQKLDKKNSESVPGYERRLRIAIVTARNAPAHERLITSIANLEIDTDELFLLGGIEKKRVLDVLKPHIILTINWGISLPLRMTSLRYIFHLALPIHPNSDSGAKRDREALHSR